MTPLTLTVDGEQVLLYVWEFGGPEALREANRIFLVPRCLYLVVLGAREIEGNAEVESWLQQISTVNDNAPVIVVLNQIDLGQVELDRFELQRQHPNIRAFVETSCKRGRGLSALRTAITVGLKELLVQISWSWNVVQLALEKQPSLFLSYEQFREICILRGVTDEVQQDAIAEAFHSLGTLLNNKDYSRLRDTMILRPQWLHTAIHQILNDPVAENSGIISADELARTLGPEVPRSIHHFLVDLLRCYELAFPCSDDGQTYLIPALLSKAPPSALDGFSSDRSLTFEYVYNVLPDGLLPRFMARTHQRSIDQPRWRTGVVIEFEGCHALVNAEASWPRISIRVIGPVTDRRRLLDIIRAEFAAIHFTLPSIVVEERVPVPGRSGLSVSYQQLLALVRTGQTTFTQVHGSNVVHLDAAALLEGSDSEAPLRNFGLAIEPAGPLKVYCSYSRKDSRYLEELLTHLKILERQGLISVWSDRNLAKGEPWEEPLRAELERADLYLLLVSPNYLASDFTHNVEIPRALERHKAGQAVVIPIIIRPVNWHEAAFAHIQVLPQDARPVSQWPDFDLAWANVAEGIKKVIDLRKRGNTSPRKRTLRVARIALKNVRCFESMVINLNPERPGQFTLLFGENGVGKSTILRSLAVGLCPQTKAAALVEQLKGSIIRNGASEAHISLELLAPETGQHWSVETAFTMENGELKLRREAPDGFPTGNVFVCGYGAGRRGLALGEPSQQYESDNAVLSLFNYQAPLQNPELVLRRLATDRGSLNEMLYKLDAALSLEFGSTTLDSSGVRIKGPWGDFIPAGALGDGYQATLAWVVDFLGWQAIFDKECPLADISGVVLVDEIEQHLHPLWQREIVQQLAKGFPNVQFLTTSHSPVCAGGLADIDEDRAKLIVLENKEGRTIAKDVPPPVGMRYDQIMTSEVIGMQVARDKTTEEILAEIRHAFEQPEPGYSPGKSPRFTAAMEKLRDRSVTAAEDEDTRLTQERLANEMAEIRKMMSVSAHGVDGGTT